MEDFQELEDTPETENKPEEDIKEENKDENRENIESLPGNEDLSAFQIAERKKRTVFVGNIPSDMKPKKLWKIFKH